jgi:REP element-mobilizing transposase RayT
MARKPRIHFPGAVYHVMLRGNGGQDIFFCPSDRACLYSLLQEGIEKYKYRVHAFCLMANHLHILIQIAEIPLSKIIQNISFRYTRYINKTQKKTGHLFQGRYKAILIDADSYLLQVVRYIHNNPLRAKIVHTAEEYPWSSHHAYLGRTVIPWLYTDWVLGQFSNDVAKARQLYAEFVAQGEKEGYRPEFSKGRLLGDDRFTERALALAEEKIQANFSLEEVVDTVCEAYGLDKKVLSSPGRRRDVSEVMAMAALLVLEAEHLTLTGLSILVDRDISGLSQGARRLQERLIMDQSLQERMKRIKGLLNIPKSQA